MTKDLSEIIAPISHTFQQVRPYLPTLSPAQYNFYKDSALAPAQAILEKTGKSWNEILNLLGLPHPLDRDTLSHLSQSLHLLEKKIVETMGLGWHETTFRIKNCKKMRPDSFNLEGAYLRNKQLHLLDVKLSICSSPITIYKYLPIFEEPPIPSQMTFFSSWLPESANVSEPGVSIGQDGQLGLFGENNILYICYLVGKPHPDFLPGSEISMGRVASAKKKKLPKNMEVRFLEFYRLPMLYARLAGTECDEEKVAPILGIAQKIKEVVLTLPKDAGKIGRELLGIVKNNRF